MKHMKLRTRAILISLVLALVAFGVGMPEESTHAQSGNGYDLTWSIIGSGGGSSTGGGYELGGTMGQPDASTISGGGYTLAGGFWGFLGGALNPVNLHLPLIQR